MDNYMPVKLYTGIESIKKHDAEFDLGKKCLIITGKYSAKVSGALEDVLEVLNNKGIEYTIFDEIVENPLMSTCIKAGRLSFDFDFIIGIGGGSVLDATKVISIICTNKEILKEDIYSLNWKNKGLPFILVGITSGTGSEVTKVAVITDDESGRKKSTHHDDFYAKVAFGDPRYTETLNQEYTSSTAIDALSHMVESYFSNKANDISRAYSIAGIKIIWQGLCILQNNEKLDIKDRENLYNASILGGLAINITGTTFAHNVGYYITEHYKKPHGIACAMFMNDLLEFEKVSDEEYYCDFFKSININEYEFRCVASNLVPDLDFKMTIEEIDSIMPRYENNNSVKNTKGKMMPKDVRDILIKKFDLC